MLTCQSARFTTLHRPAGISSTAIGLATLIAVAALAAARPAAADCVGAVRPATAQEKKAYTDGLAMFLRIAPTAPAGWEQSDSPTETTLTEVCDATGEPLTRWTFSRSFTRTEGSDERRTQAEEQGMAIVQRGEATAKANEAKLAAVQRKIDEQMLKLQTLAAQQKIGEIDAATAELAKLMEEQQKLMGLPEQGAAMDAVDAAAVKDTSAQFSLTVGETNVDTRAFTPTPVPVGKGFRQELEDRGNPWVDLLVVLPGQRVVYVRGDPVRAEELLKAANLR